MEYVIEVVLAGVSGLLGILTTVLFWNFKDMKATAVVTAKELADYKIYVAERYVTHGDLTAAIQAMRDGMRDMTKQLSDIQGDLKEFNNRFSDKLEKKQDKS